MSRMRLTLLSVLAVLAVGAVASASASAHEFLLQEGTLPEKVEGTGGECVLEAVGITIKGERSTVADTLEAGGKSEGTLVCEHNKVTTGTCKLSKEDEAEVIASFSDQLEEKGGALEDHFTGSEAGEVFVKITLEECALEGTFSIKGKQWCELPKAGEFQTEHEIVCLAAGSELKLGSLPATFSNSAKNVHELGAHALKGWKAL